VDNLRCWVYAIIKPMKNIFKNPLFYLSVVLVIAVAFTVFNLVKADSFREPTQSFPQSNVNAPIDESDTPQTKKGSLTIGKALIPNRICLPNSVYDSTKVCRSYWSQFESSGGASGGLEVRGFGDIYGSRTSGPHGDNLGEWDFCALRTDLVTERGGRTDLRGCQVTKSGSDWILSTVGDARCGAYCFNLSSDGESGSRR
jgi:hypothetical protein